MTQEFEGPSQLTSAEVHETMQEIRGISRTNEALSKGEFRHLVLESLVLKRHLPLKNIEGFEIPDFEDPKVMDLNLQLDRFESLFFENLIND